MMLKRILIAAASLAVVLWFLSQPPPVPEALGDLDGDAAAGELVFAAAGCASCHVAQGAPVAPAPTLAGGQAFPSDFGTFYAPNISSDPDQGIGNWSDAELVHAITAGVSPQRRYYYPVFPTHAYALADTQDIADLVAYLRTLPADDTPSTAHEVGFPFNIRRGLWLWRFAFEQDDWVGPAATDEAARGRYLVEALGHCAECHTPRNLLGGLDRSRWMGGAPVITGRGQVPNLTPAALDWSVEEIADYLESGFTPDYDVVGGKMADVVENTSRLSPEDRQAIAVYLKSLP